MSRFSDPSGIIIRNPDGKILAITNEEGGDELELVEEEEAQSERDALAPNSGTL